jgi:hypothetical protein
MTSIPTNVEGKIVTSSEGDAGQCVVGARETLHPACLAARLQTIFAIGGFFGSAEETGGATPLTPNPSPTGRRVSRPQPCGPAPRSDPAR